jgi:hypothetical protein
MKISLNLLLLNSSIKTKYNIKNTKIAHLHKNYFNKSKLVYNGFKNHLLKKEYIYTKLKYSRVPQVDYVSGGIASLLAGLLGFLVTEKFGFELLDSGDFYILFYYIIFIFVVIRIFFKANILDS